LHGEAMGTATRAAQPVQSGVPGGAATSRKPSGLEWKNEFRWPESLGIVFGSEVVLRSSPAVGVLQSII
jgi:hypothetical protein